MTDEVRSCPGFAAAGLDRSKHGFPQIDALSWRFTSTNTIIRKPSESIDLANRPPKHARYWIRLEYSRK